MSTTKKTTLSTWLVWAPLKFACISFSIMTITAIIYGLISTHALNPAPIPQTPLVLLLTLAFISSVAILWQILPSEKINQSAFIAVHNIQTFVLSTAFFVSSYFILSNTEQIIFNLLLIETQHPTSFFITFLVSCLFYLYLSGIFFANLYAKIYSIRTLQIPTWKIIFSIPFGFSALWTPAYFLVTQKNKDTSISIQTQWYNKLTQWITAKKLNTAVSFTSITVISGLFFGLNSILLTFALTLIFGIWLINTGEKNFTKNIGKKYSTYAVILNLVLWIIIFGFNAFVHPTTQNVQMNIYDTQITNQ